VAGSRDNFSANVKRVLGSRVAFRCCFPGCGILTIGPKTVNDSKYVNIGQAAHIHGASPGGPRYDPKMTAEERRSYTNGIWMCSNHATLIDVDEGNYSAITIRQWKQKMEAEIYRELKDLTKLVLPEPTTLICLTPKLIFEGIWAGAENDTWRFTVKHFVYGDLNRLLEYRTGLVPGSKDYIIVESQGDGRLIEGGFQWVRQNDLIEISAKVFPSAIRRNPNFIGSAPAMCENILENGRLRLISGKELAIQKIDFLLNTPQGSMFMNRGYGTLFRKYYLAHRNETILISRLIKLDLTRLISIPTNPQKLNRDPELNFINRINEVEVLDESNGRVILRLALEWGDGSLWAGNFQVYLNDKALGEIAETLIPIKAVGGNRNLKLMDQLRELTSSLPGEEMKLKINKHSLLDLFTQILPAIMNKADQSLEMEIYPLFSDYHLLRTFDNNTFEYLTSYDLEKHFQLRGLIHDMSVIIKLEGFKKAGLDAFNVTSDLVFQFNDYNYTIGPCRAIPWITKLYGQLPNEAELDKLTADFINHIIRQINDRIIEVKSKQRP
jgi:hypothetical protein